MVNVVVMVRHTDVDVIFFIMVKDVKNVSSYQGFIWMEIFKECFIVSSKAIQSIIALVIIILMGLIGFCLKFDICSYCRPRARYCWSETVKTIYFYSYF